MELVTTIAVMAMETHTEATVAMVAACLLTLDMEVRGSLLKTHN